MVYLLEQPLFRVLKFLRLHFTNIPRTQIFRLMSEEDRKEMHIKAFMEIFKRVGNVTEYRTAKIRRQCVTITKANIEIFQQEIQQRSWNFFRLIPADT